MRVPKYIEKAILRMDDPKDADDLAIAIAKLMPHTARRVGMHLQGAVLTENQSEKWDVIGREEA